MAFPLSPAEHQVIKARIEGQLELVVAAAIQVEVRGFTYNVSVERPGRHGEIIGLLHSLGLDHANQGFITNHGRFVDRQEAARIVHASEQGSTRDFGPGHPHSLFSEDMWNDTEAD